MPRPPQPHWLLKIHEDFEKYLMTFPGERRGKIRRRVRKLDKDMKEPVRMVRVTTPAQVPEFLAQVEKVSAISWQGTRLQQVVKDAPEERAKLMRQAEHGWLRSYLLYVGERCIAFVIGAQESGIFYYERIGYDPSLSQYAPGIVLFYKIVEDLHAHDRPSWLDFGTGDNNYKRLYGTESFDCVDVYLLRRSPYMGAARTVHRSLVVAEQAARDVIDRYGLRTRVLRILRRGDAAGPASAPAPSSEDSD
jgi:CelD/BcsL family acetyltransferase involved in cellulose biosynthesis